MSFGSFVVAHFSDPEKLLPAVKILTHRHDVLRWDAVHGSSQLIVKLKPSPPPSIPEPTLRIDGTDRFTNYDIVSDYEKDEAIDPTLCRAYLFVEAEPLKRDAVLKFLRESEAVIQYSTVGSGSEFVVLIQGKNFGALDTLIHGTLRALDGVVRLRVNRVIELHAL